LNFFVNRQTNAGAESFNAKVKAFRRQFREVSDIPSSYLVSVYKLQIIFNQTFIFDEKQLSLGL
jgi:hypothetical protein